MAQREYEYTIILRPDLALEPTRALRDRLTAIITQRGGTILHNMDLGKRPLAYEIAKQKRGSYYYYNFIAGGDVVAELERICRLDENVLRFLSIVTSEHVDLPARQAAHDADVKRLESMFGLQGAIKPDAVAAAPVAPSA